MSVSATSESRVSESATELFAARRRQSTAPTSVCSDSAHPQTPKQQLAHVAQQLSSPLSPNRGISLVTRSRLGAQSNSRTPLFAVKRPNYERAQSSDDLSSLRSARTADIFGLYGHTTSSSVNLTNPGSSLLHGPSASRIYQLSSAAQSPKPAKIPISRSFTTLTKRLFSKSRDKGGNIGRGPYVPPQSSQLSLEFGCVLSTPPQSSELDHELSRMPSQLQQVLNHATGQRHDVSHPSRLNGMTLTGHVVVHHGRRTALLCRQTRPSEMAAM